MLCTHIARTCACTHIHQTPSEAVMDDSGGKAFGGKGDTLMDVVEEGAEVVLCVCANMYA